jgi:hypothetical protein
MNEQSAARPQYAQEFGQRCVDLIGVKMLKYITEQHPVKGTVGPRQRCHVTVSDISVV